jgi:hypothetical protein
MYGRANTVRIKDLQARDMWRSKADISKIEYVI